MPASNLGQKGIRRVHYDEPYNALLPTYHRLDVSVERTFEWPHVALTLQATGINVYDRRNIFFVGSGYRTQQNIPLPDDVIQAAGFRSTEVDFTPGDCHLYP